MSIVSELDYWELHKRLDHTSFTDLVSFERNPRVYSMSKRRAPSELMIRGQLTDTLLLAPSELEERFTVLPFDDLRTKAAKAFKMDAELAGKHVVKQQWLNQAQEEVSSLLAETTTVPAPRDILAAGRGQIAIRQRFGSVWFLSKPDWAPSPGGAWGDWLIDLKRTSVDEVSDWGAKVANYRYHWQAASQLDAYNTEYPSDQRTRYGWLLVTEHDCGLLECDPDDIALGRTEYVESLQRYRAAFEANEWPSPFHSRTGEPRMSSLPAWYRRKSFAVTGDSET